MRQLVLGAALGALVLGSAAPAHAQSPVVAATAPAPGAAAVVPVPGAAAVAAFVSGQAAAGQQVVPVQNGNGFTLLVTGPLPPPDQPSWVTNLPARSWFEAEGFSSFASSDAPRP
jgi:hypothetical protein